MHRGEAPAAPRLSIELASEVADPHLHGARRRAMGPKAQRCHASTKEPNRTIRASTTDMNPASTTDTIRANTTDMNRASTTDTIRESTTDMIRESTTDTNRESTGAFHVRTTDSIRGRRTDCARFRTNRRAK
jgi:hypothetical protein